MSEATENGETGVVTGAGRVLGLDVGNRRIGLAMTDGLGITAQPMFTMERKTPLGDLKWIARIVRKHGVREIVIGLPLHSSGKMSAQAAKTQAFGARLGEMLPGVTVHWMDERLTTAEAHGLLDESRGPVRGGKAGRKERTAVVDQVAAVLLLEAFLSVRSPALLPRPAEDE